MKVTYNWLRDFVDIRMTPQQLAERLTMAGLEVTSLRQSDGDYMLEIEITSNRPDWLSVSGIAREVAAITGTKARLPVIKSPAEKTKGLFKIKVENNKDCPLYTAKLIRSVKVAPSPGWLKKRLELVGCRSVNNVVDITNYVMFEMGEPLHAFDADKLNSDTIFVRRAHKGEKIATIDGQERLLQPDNLVIADCSSAVAVAGVMGGKDTEVGESTVNVLLEAAVFNPVVTRRSRRLLGLQSESSYRFERGVDAQVAQAASWRAVRLIEEICAGKCVCSSSSPFKKPVSKIIGLKSGEVSSVLGVEISSSRIKNMLVSLGFAVKSDKKDALQVSVPGFRQDVSSAVDLIEEVARIYGYEKIPTTIPAVKPRIDGPGARQKVSFVKDLLTGMGLREVITYTMVDRGLLESYIPKESLFTVDILDPLSKEQEVLRPVIAPSLAKCVAYNLNQQQPCVNIFEVSHVFRSARPEPEEEMVLAIALCGSRTRLFKNARVQDECSLLHLKGIAESLLDKLRISDYDFSAKDDGIEIFVHKQPLGIMQRLKKEVLDKVDIKNKDVFVMEIKLGRLLSFSPAGKSVSALPKYPAITRDISLVVKEDCRIRDIIKSMFVLGAPLLSSAQVVDYYSGKQIPQGSLGLTISCTYRLAERTLTEDEVSPLHLRLLSSLEENFGVKTR